MGERVLMTASFGRRLLSVKVLGWTLLLGSLGAAPPAAALTRARGGGAARKALEISIFGFGAVLDARAYDQVMSLAGELVAGRQVQKFLVRGWGIEGGASFCLELSPWAGDDALADIKTRFEAIKPNVRTTSYHIKTAHECEPAG